MKKFKLREYHRSAILELLKRNRELADEISENEYLLEVYRKQYELPGEPDICEACGCLAFHHDCEGIALCDKCINEMQESES